MCAYIDVKFLKAVEITKSWKTSSKDCILNKVEKRARTNPWWINKIKDELRGEIRAEILAEMGKAPVQVVAS